MNSSAPIWSLATDFAALFDVMLTGDDLDRAIGLWQRAHLTRAGRARVEARRRHDAGAAGVPVDLPDGTRIMLPVGEASEITRDVVELMAPRLLIDPAVIFMATGEVPVPAHFATLNLDPAVLTDVVLFDLDQGDVWLIEVVATDGVVTAERRRALVEWAEANGMSGEQCRFVTAFKSRTAAALRRRVSELAWESTVWFSDEPDGIIYLNELT